MWVYVLICVATVCFSLGLIFEHYSHLRITKEDRERDSYIRPIQQHTRQTGPTAPANYDPSPKNLTGPIGSDSISFYPS